MTSNIPEGFHNFGTDDSFNSAIAPLYLNTQGEYLLIGMEVEKRHCNPVGFLHGGAMMTLIDVGLSSALGYALGKFMSTPTISLTTNFMKSAKVGDWVQMRIDSLEIRRSVAFVGGTVEGPHGSLVICSACFKLPEDIENEPGMTLEQYLDWQNKIS